MIKIRLANCFVSRTLLYQFERISMQGKNQYYIKNKKWNALSYLYGHNSIDIKQVSTTFKRKAIGH